MKSGENWRRRPPLADCTKTYSGDEAMHRQLAQPLTDGHQHQEVPRIEQVGPAPYRWHGQRQWLTQQPETEQRGQGAADDHRPGEGITTGCIDIERWPVIAQQAQHQRPYPAGVGTLQGIEKRRRQQRAQQFAPDSAALARELPQRQIPIDPGVLVVGGGIAGIHAALTLADSGANLQIGGVAGGSNRQTLTDADVFLLGERGVYAPPGVAGGLEGGLNRFTWESDEGERSPPLASKVTDVRVRAGQKVRIESPGGGGYGPATARDPVAVARDVQVENSYAQVERAVYDLVAQYGGSVSAEHGIGLVKRELLARSLTPPTLALMRAIKAQFDPDGILNPGKVLPPA